MCAETENGMAGMMKMEVTFLILFHRLFEDGTVERNTLFSPFSFLFLCSIIFGVRLSKKKDATRRKNLLLVLDQALRD